VAWINLPGAFSVHLFCCICALLFIKLYLVETKHTTPEDARQQLEHHLFIKDSRFDLMCCPLPKSSLVQQQEQREQEEVEQQQQQQEQGRQEKHSIDEVGSNRGIAVGEETYDVAAAGKFKKKTKTKNSKTFEMVNRQSSYSGELV
jgi:hypothetical protein